MSADKLTSGTGDPGSLLFIGIQGTSLTPETEKLLKEVRPGGVILFKRNIESLQEAASLCRRIRECCDPPPLIAVDEEGGRVTRLEPHVRGLPDAFSTAKLQPEKLEEYWLRYGRLLGAIGFDIDFAPVVDLCPPDAPNGIADRSYGVDPDQVIEAAGRVLDGLAAAGLLPTLKHFPGLGHTLLDSHHHLPTIQLSRAEFEASDLKPFAGLAGRVPAVMIGHGHYPFYSGEAPVAATLSRRISTGLLREQIGFKGAAISDDLEMKAVAARVPWKELPCRAVEAGNDMLLICHDPVRIREAATALRERAAADEAFGRRCAEAMDRVSALHAAASGASAAREGGTVSLAEAREHLLETAAAIPAARI